jgi:hypothetical protein
MPKHQLKQIHAKRGGKVLSANVESSFIDSVELDVDAGILSVEIDGTVYEYEGDKRDFQSLRREGGAFFNEVLRPQDPGGKK